MMRLRVSTLDGFRLMLTEEWKSQEELIESIRAGQSSVPSEAMKIGTAWHKVLEKPHSCLTPTGFYAADGYVFDQSQVRAALQEVGPGLAEQEYVREIEIPGYPTFELKGTTDHKYGLILTDFKTKVRSTPSAEDYEKSLQWRCYLWLTGCHEFRYMLFPAFPDEKTGAVEIREPLTFSFFTYAGIEAEIRRWLRQFMDWANSHHLLPFLERAP